VSPNIPVSVASNGWPTTAAKFIMGCVLSQAKDGVSPFTHIPDHSKEGYPIAAMDGVTVSGVQVCAFD
jgi:hypothetical protein